MEPWGATFRKNLADTLLRRNPPSAPVTSFPGKFWQDVFVQQPLPWRRFAESAGYHALFIAALYGISILPVRPTIQPAHTLDKSQVLYFDASEYLPPIDTGEAKPGIGRKADPEYAKQPILSVPPEARNDHQTIVSEPNVQLNQDVATPNIVAWGDHTVPVPVDATQRGPVSLASLNTPVVAPAPAAVERRANTPSLDSSIVAPPPPVDVSDRRLSDVNLAPSAIIAPAPQLAVDARRVPSGLNAGNASVVPPPPAMDSANARDSQQSRTALAASVVPPPPSAGNAASASGSRLIALGIHPTVAPPPADPGNRQGSFAAGPNGKAGASGAPGTMTATNTSGHARDNSGSGSSSGKALRGAPSGLQVGAGPSSATGAIAGDPHTSTSNTVNPNLLAKASPPPSLPHGATASAQASELERKVFGDRPFYSMTLNMPNLNSAGGSWIMRFAELNDSGSTVDLSAPRALHKVDPAYPLELMRQNVQGTVAVRAIIRTDGSVSDVKVLRSVDERLDRYACDALAHWQFEPATRSGAPVDLAVVVMIPFRPVARPHF